MSNIQDTLEGKRCGNCGKPITGWNPLCEECQSKDCPPPYTNDPDDMDWDEEDSCRWRWNRVQVPI